MEELSASIELGINSSGRFLSLLPSLLFPLSSLLCLLSMTNTVAIFYQMSYFLESLLVAAVVATFGDIFMCSSSTTERGREERERRSDTIERLWATLASSSAVDGAAVTSAVNALCTLLQGNFSTSLRSDQLLPLSALLQRLALTSHTGTNSSSRLSLSPSISLSLSPFPSLTHTYPLISTQ